MIDLGTLASLALATIAGIVWLVRLEGRINVADQRALDIIARLERIEALLDSLVKLNGRT